VCGDIYFVTVSVTLLAHAVSYSPGSRLPRMGNVSGVGDVESFGINLRGFGLV
jgi:hypothetical protein